MIKIKLRESTNIVNKVWLLLDVFTLFCLAIIIMREIQSVRETRIEDIES